MYEMEILVRIYICVKLFCMQTLRSVLFKVSSLYNQLVLSVIQLIKMISTLEGCHNIFFLSVWLAHIQTWSVICCLVCILEVVKLNWSWSVYFLKMTRMIILVISPDEDDGHCVPILFTSAAGDSMPRRWNSYFMRTISLTNSCVDNGLDDCNDGMTFLCCRARRYMSYSIVCVNVTAFRHTLSLCILLLEAVQ